jgi:hypothetical protein
VDDDLDVELRRLFSDDRLDVHATPDATDAVLRGAGRRRRRRSAMTTAFAMVVLVGAGIGLVQLRPPSDDTASELMPTSTSSSSTPPPSVSTVISTVIVTVDPPPNSGGSDPGKTSTGTPTRPRTSTPPVTPESQPGKYGSLALGMSEADALKSGSLVEPGSSADPENKCKAYATKSVPDANAVIISPAVGIVRITLPNYAKTQKNVGAGSTAAEVKTAYPSATQSGSNLTVPMTAAPKWTYVFETDGATVTTVLMRLDANDCPAV